LTYLFVKDEFVGLYFGNGDGAVVTARFDA